VVIDLMLYFFGIAKWLRPKSEDIFVAGAGNLILSITKERKNPSVFGFTLAQKGRK